MILEKYLTDNKTIVTSLAQFVIFLSVTMVAPLIHNQLITGSIVNAILFVATATLGLVGASLICLVPSLFALISGTLPAPLASLIPFIMLSNIILVLIFNYFKKTNFWLGIFSASLLKFLFLIIILSVVVNYFFSGATASLAITMFSWPQLLTAVSGGLLAYFILKFNKAF